MPNAGTAPFTERRELDKAINALDMALQIIKENKEFSDWKSILEQEKVRVVAMQHH